MHYLCYFFTLIAQKSYAQTCTSGTCPTTTNCSTTFSPPAALAAEALLVMVLPAPLLLQRGRQWQAVQQLQEEPQLKDVFQAQQQGLI